MRGRGTADNPQNRFEQIAYQKDPHDPDDEISSKTKIFADHSKSIIAYNDSPDVGFSASINPYRGCEHGCVYCYARPTHEYLSLSSGLDFETKIFAKMNAATLLKKELAAKSWKPQVLALSGVTDCYQPIERKLKITRSCLEVLAQFHNPLCIITKNHLVTRDIDILQEMASRQEAAVFVSVTSLDSKLSQLLEPRASQPQARLATIRELAAAGIPVGFLLAPIIPGLNDYEIPSIIDACVKAGARFSGSVMLRLPHSVKDLFSSWLEQHFPDRKDKVLNRIREMRNGKLSDSEFGSRMQGSGVFADSIHDLFELACKKSGILNNRLKLTAENFCVPGVKRQIELF